ncbi:MAG: HD domain-containing protein [Spirochaetia bacterium]|nr:HD domain-containing protein [Spirochaetia bacterium]
MFLKFENAALDLFLSPNQKNILNLALSLDSVEKNQAFKELEDGKTFEELFVFPVRFMLEEKKYLELSATWKQDSENHLDRALLVVYSTENRSVGIHFSKCFPPATHGYRIDGQNIILNQTIQTDDALSAAGFISCFPDISCAKPESLHINDNFIEIPFANRRFYIEQIVLSKKPSAGFFFLDELGILTKILPEVAAGKNLSQNKYHKYDIFEHLVRSCDSMEIPDIVLRFSALLHDIGKVPTRRVKENGEATFYNHEIVSSHMLVPVMKRFGIPKPLGMKIKYYVRNHMFHYTDEWSDKAIRRFLRKVSREDLANLILLRKSDRVGSGKTNPFPKKLQKLIDHIDDVIMKDMELKVTDLEINGRNLMDMGLTEGPFMGKILNTLLYEVKNEKTGNSHDALILRARSLIQDSEFALGIHTHP